MRQNSKTDPGRKPAVDEGAVTLTLAQQAREMLESFAVAFILMLLMRNCLGENYQIPTGSMAPTLQGRHMDVLCDQCGYQYRTGASIENVDQGQRRGEVTGTTCPICRYPMELDKKGNPNHGSFSGDRIIVSKLAYWLAKPKRWDVIVFKCPADAKVNYIKRLIGLPGETLRIRHGDIYVLDPAGAADAPEQERFRIARKPPDKVAGMLQLVDDTYYIGNELQQAGWPSRWVPISQGTETAWRHDLPRSEFIIDATEKGDWLRYRHLVPRHEDWRAILDGQKPNLGDYQGRLITDYYAYNDANFSHSSDDVHWVGDLAVECEMEVTTGSGEVLLDLVEGGAHFGCSIDVATGKATLSVTNGPASFQDEQGTTSLQPQAMTAVRGPGHFRMRFANVDDQLFLWVDDEIAVFDGPTTFRPATDVVPQWTPDDAGDFMPLGIGARKLSMRVSRLRVLRDVYYLALMSGARRFYDYDYRFGSLIDDVLTNPHSLDRTAMFNSRVDATFTMGPDQFFPLGDNSPQSKDARLWSFVVDGKLDPPPAVNRELLIGKAVSIYWPHAWYLPAFPVWPIVVPNYQRIGFIH